MENITVIENIVLDIRYAMGRFIAQPITTVIIILTLALGIGSTTAIFSVVNGLINQATPFTDSDRLVMMQQNQFDQHKNESDSDNQYGFSAREIFDFRDQASKLDQIAEYHQMTFTLYGHGDPVRVRTGVVSANYFEMLGLTPVIGRLLNPGEDEIGAEPLVMLTYEFWKSQFGGREDVINSSVEMNNRAHKIIGVLPHFPQFPEVNDIFIAVPSCPFRSGEMAQNQRAMRMVSGLGQMKPGVSINEVSQQMSAVAQRLSQSYPESYPTKAGFGASALSLNEELTKGNRPYLLTLLATTVLLFLIACANVTNLTLSQHAKRQREFAVRASLGASRARLAQLLLTESLILALLGGLAGLLLAWLGVDILKSSAARFTSLASEIELDSNVMLFALAMSVLAGIISGLAPSFGKVNLVTSLKEGGKASVTTSNGVVRNGLLIAQFALSLTLLVVAGLSIKSLNKLQNVDGGFDTENVEIVQLDLNWTVYSDRQQQWQFSHQILDQVRQLPYVSTAGLSMTYPMDTVLSNEGIFRRAIRFDDRDYDPDFILPNTFRRPVTDGYFRTIGAKLLQGRFFERSDDQQAPRVAIINKTLADTLWPAKSAVNHKFSVDNGENWFTIVGVTGNIMERGLSGGIDFQIYLPMAQSPVNHIAVVAKVGQQQVDFETDLKKIVSGLDNRQALSKAESLQQAVDNSLALQSMLAQLLSIFSIIALLITVSGISGVMSYLVNLRTREIGIRMAIGADKTTVILLITSYGLKLAITGLVIGLATAWWGGSLLSAHLFNLSAFDLPVYAVSLLTLLTVSAIACLIPALRASSIAPMRALRTN